MLFVSYEKIIRNYMLLYAHASMLDYNYSKLSKNERISDMRKYLSAIMKEKRVINPFYLNEFKSLFNKELSLKPSSFFRIKRVFFSSINNVYLSNDNKKNLKFFYNNSENINIQFLDNNELFPEITDFSPAKAEEKAMFLYFNKIDGRLTDFYIFQNGNDSDYVDDFDFRVTIIKSKEMIKNDLEDLISVTLNKQFR